MVEPDQLEPHIEIIVSINSEVLKAEIFRIKIGNIIIQNSEVVRTFFNNPPAILPSPTSQPAAIKGIWAPRQFHLLGIIALQFVISSIWIGRRRYKNVARIATCRTYTVSHSAVLFDRDV